MLLERRLITPKSVDGLPPKKPFYAYALVGDGRSYVVDIRPYHVEDYDVLKAVSIAKPQNDEKGK